MDIKQDRDIFYIWEWTFELAKGIIIFLAVLVLIHFFIATIFVVDGASMEPNFHDKQYILVEKITYLVAQPQRGDAVVTKFPGDPDHKIYIKRIVGLPGETLEIRNNRVFINDVLLNEYYINQNVLTEPDMKIALGKNEYFIMGDNRENSNDSRAWGVCAKKNFIGRAQMVLLPFKNFSLLPEVEY